MNVQHRVPHLQQVDQVHHQASSLLVLVVLHLVARDLNQHLLLMDLLPKLPLHSLIMVILCHSISLILGLQRYTDLFLTLILFCLSSYFLKVLLTLDKSNLNSSINISPFTNHLILSDIFLCFSFWCIYHYFFSFSLVSPTEIFVESQFSSTATIGSTATCTFPE